MWEGRAGMIYKLVAVPQKDVVNDRVFNDDGFNVHVIREARMWNLVDFVRHALGIEGSVELMPGAHRLSGENLVDMVAQVRDNSTTPNIEDVNTLYCLARAIRADGLGYAVYLVIE